MTDPKLEDFPPSVRLVYRVLYHDGECTQKEIAGNTPLAVRTVRDAVERLEEAELIEIRTDPNDARRRIYSLAS